MNSDILILKSKLVVNDPMTLGLQKGVCKKVKTPWVISQMAKKEYKPISDKANIPLTLSQINHHLNQDSIFDDQSFYTISIVGRLESFRRENNSNMFLFCDGTGQLQGRINLTSGKMPAFAEGITFEDKYGDYFFVVFKPKFSQGEKKFYIQMIKHVENYNMITKHFSDVILSALIRKRNM